ncbi:MAG: hypothetical protein SH817_17335 [Leptospira sp.]|nr:hypothetical protein [Leptospira sp.]
MEDNLNNAKKTYSKIECKRKVVSTESIKCENGTLVTTLATHPNLKIYSNTGEFHQYVTPTFEEFIHRIQDSLPIGRTMNKNDHSFPKGADTNWHDTYMTVMELDKKYPSKNDTIPFPGEMWNDKNSTYPREKTIELIRRAASQLPDDYELNVLFNDTELYNEIRKNMPKGLKIIRSEKGHYDHLHFYLTKKKMASGTES